MEAIYGLPKMSGEIDQLWDTVPKMCVTSSGDVTSTTGSVRAMWDDHAIYFLVEVNDAILNAESPTPYFQDSIEIFIDEFNDKAIRYEEDDLHFRINYKNEKTVDSGNITRLYSRSILTETGYIIEARIGLSEKPKNEQVIGFDLQINDADATGKRVATLSLFDQTGQAYAMPKLFGELKLVGKEPGEKTSINRYDLLAYLDYAKSLNQAVYINGESLNVKIDAAEKLLASHEFSQTEIDQALVKLKETVASLRRTNQYTEPHRLPKLDQLPDIFTFGDGAKVNTEADWWQRAEEIRDMYQFYMYGYMPDTSKEKVGFERTDSGMIIKISVQDKETSFPVIVTLPGDQSKFKAPFPVIITNGGLDLAFDEETMSFVRPKELPKEDLVNQRGYAVITIKPANVAADNASRTGAFFDLYPYSEVDNDVGTLIAWAWGAGKVIDALELNAFPEINPKQVGITGFSRFGKAALVAGALDHRFALVNPHASGLGGMTLFRSSYNGKVYPWGVAGPGEEIGSLQSSALNHWFTSVFLGFESIDQLPFDQHQLAALVAPRGLIITCGYADYHTNPEGMYDSLLEAKKVYQLLNAEENIGIAYRPGAHSIEFEDIERVLDFGDQLFRQIKPAKDFSIDKYDK
ncbi:glucuronyl esterase domain-containing protein [Amphibacillus xylanus]|uniref:Putative hydrolase n=1 Tax=Amphibacillus xylanus (strain ATCC 51415 / DSM 6626 / JCM 7361 / LMG 17667 / NBRC 15112 / Ep01) TaxID=698758 RepID=K0J4X8_AMPXN|nr:sugar-binding protein [Amphibacillus xylanus]BAM47881.1 putative hydrolase [Amphibacillus xylanus NBRC 15112]